MSEELERYGLKPDDWTVLIPPTAAQRDWISARGRAVRFLISSLRRIFGRWPSSS